MQVRSQKRPVGFTLVEILVVIAIIGLLIGLLLPAIQSAREAARKAHCQNNLKQLGIAMHLHMAAMKTLPPGYVSDVLPDHDDAGPGWGWGVRLLPFCEQTALFEQVEFEKPIAAYAATKVRMQGLPLFTCPSDSHFEPILDIPVKGSNQIACKMAAASYVGSAGTVRPSCKMCRDLFDGVYGRNRPIKAADITDGLSNTLAAGERNNFWASASMWGVVPKSKLPDHQQPGIYAAGPAYVLGTTFKDGFNIEELPMDDHNQMGTYAESFGSPHPGGCFFVFCDGGVRFVFDAVDPGTMNALATRDGNAKGGNLVDPVIHESPF